MGLVLAELIKKVFGLGLDRQYWLLVELK